MIEAGENIREGNAKVLGNTKLAHEGRSRALKIRKQTPLRVRDPGSVLRAFIRSNKASRALHVRFIYERDQILFLVPRGRLCDTSIMSLNRLGRNTRALISLHVFLRLTSMDVCCGPPASL